QWGGRRHYVIDAPDSLQRVAWMGAQYHFLPEDSRLNSCLRKPRCNRVVSLASPPSATAATGTGETSAAATCSGWVSPSVELAIDSPAPAGSSRSSSCNSSAATGAGSCKYFRATTE